MNSCSLCDVCRYQVNADGEIFPCLTGKSAIGKVTDKQYIKQINAGQVFDASLLDRNCKDCANKAYCAKCCMLPRAISKEDYCEMMQNGMIINDYIFKREMLKYLILSSKHIKNNSEIAISHFKRPLVFDGQLERATGKILTSTQQATLIYKVENNYFLFNLRNGNIIDIDRRLIFIIEGYTYGFEVEYITNCFAKYFNLKSHEAKIMIEKGISLLRNNELII